MKKLWITLVASAVFLVLSGCNNDKENTQEPIKINEPIKIENKQELDEVKQQAQSLFDQLINLEAKDSEQEAFAVIDKIALKPEEYKKSLKNNHIKLNVGRYIRANAAHRDDEVKKLPNGNYLYTSFATIEIQESKDKKPISDTFYVELELTEKGNSWKVVKLNVQPIGE